MRSNRTLLLILFLSCWCLLTTSTAQTAFTAADQLEVQSLNNVAISPDGRYAVAIRYKGSRSRLDVDHFRFGDPTYIRPFRGELVIYDLEREEKHLPFAEPQHIVRPTWSPDSRQLAFFRVENEKYRLYTLRIHNLEIQPITPDTEKELAGNSPLEWFPDGQSLLVAVRDTGWAERGRAMFLEATEGPVIVYDASQPFLKWDAIRLFSRQNIPVRVTVPEGNTTELLPAGVYSDFQIERQGEYLAYVENHPVKTTYNRRDGTQYSLMRLDLDANSVPDTLFKPDFKQLDLRWSRDNRWIAWADSGHVKIQHLLTDTTINLTRDRNQLSETDTTKVKFSAESWSPDANRLIARSKQGLWLIDRSKQTVERFYEFPEEAEKAPRLAVEDWSPDGRYLYLSYSAADKWERGLWRYDFQAGEMQALIQDANLYQNWALAENGARFVYAFSDGDFPNELWTANAAFESPRQVSDLNPWMKDKKLTKSELVKYLDADGKELYGILYYPVDYDPDKKYPLVCEIYERFFDNGYRYSMNIVANAGYFGFRPSVNFAEGFPGEAWIKGVTAGVNKLIERGLVDPKKIGVHGTSYGGYAASLLVAQTDRFAAAINISGKTNIISFLGDSPRIGTRNYAAAEVGQDRIGASLWEAPVKYLLHSAVLFADRINTPHLLLTGEGDWNVPAANTRELYYALRRLGKKVVWVNYRHAGHGAGWAGSESDYHDQWKRMLDWYAEHFKEAEKQAQSGE